jgi:hypothetical protein
MSLIVVAIIMLCVTEWNTVLGFSLTTGIGMDLRATNHNNRIVLSKRKNKNDINPSPIVGYVPDGLTPEQYAKIKKQELDKKKKMDYGEQNMYFTYNQYYLGLNQIKQNIIYYLRSIFRCMGTTVFKDFTSRW